VASAEVFGGHAAVPAAQPPPKRSLGVGYSTVSGPARASLAIVSCADIGALRMLSDVRSAIACNSAFFSSADRRARRSRVPTGQPRRRRLRSAASPESVIFARVAAEGRGARGVPGRARAARACPRRPTRRRRRPAPASRGTRRGGGAPTALNSGRSRSRSRLWFPPCRAPIAGPAGRGTAGLDRG
jgi:hypothetical protein